MALVKSLDATAQASANAITFKQLNLEQSSAIRPEVIAVIGQPAASKEASLTENAPILSDGTKESAYALFGASPLYFAATKLFPDSGDGAKCTVYFIPVFAGGTPVQTVYSNAFTGTATESFTAYATFNELPFASASDAVGKIATNAQNNPARGPRNIQLDGFNTFSVPFSVTKGDTEADMAANLVAAVNAEFDFPATGAVVADDPQLTVKWAGDTGDTLGFAITRADGGDTSLFDPGYTVDTAGGGTFDIETALDNLTDQYAVTRVINQLDDDTSLDLVQTWGEGKRDSLIAQYAMAYCGREYLESGTLAGTVDVTAIQALGDARKDDAVNSWLYGQYGDLRELTYTQRNALLKSGVSNIQNKGGTYTLMDSVTLYHPDGVLNPIFKYDDSICKEGNIAYDLQYYLETEEWDSKILVSQSSKTTNPDAIDIDDYASAVYSRAELWEKNALIASADFVKENSSFEIDDTNPRRINANIKQQLTSTLAVTDHTLYTGFLFGESA